MLSALLGTKHNRQTSPYLRCRACGRNKYRREFRGAKGTQICKLCRAKNPRIERDIYFVQRRSDFQKQRPEIRRILVERIIREKLKKEVKNVGLMNRRAEENAEKLLKFPERAATIIGKTFMMCGEDATLSDDEALIRIRDEIDNIDGSLMKRTAKRRLP